MTATGALGVPEAFQQPQYRRASIEQVSERVIQLRAVPYGVETEIDHNLFESFEPGAFKNAEKDPGRVKLWFGHSNDGGAIVGQASSVEDLADGVMVWTRVSATRNGDELLTLADDGVLDEASIEFSPIPRDMVIRKDGERLHVRHRRGHLRGVALVPHGAYGRNALVMSVRDIRQKATEKARAAALARLAELNH